MGKNEAEKNQKELEWPSKNSEHYFENNGEKLKYFNKVYLKICKFRDYVNYFYALLQWTLVGKKSGPKKRGGQSRTMNFDTIYNSE